MLSLQAVQDLLNDKSKNKEQERMLNICRDVYYHMSLHIDGVLPAYTDLRSGNMVFPYDWRGINYQRIFETDLFSKYPNESEETRNYRLGQYKPLQKEAFTKAIQVIVGAIFQDSQYQIEIERKEDSEYIWGENFEGKHLMAYLAAHFSDICNDPNAHFVTIPKQSRTETIGKVEPEIWLVSSVDTVYNTNDEFIFKKDGFAWLVNKVGYFRYTEDKEGKWVLVEPEGYYAHLLDRLPVYVAGGILNGGGYFDSYLDAAKNVANEFIGEKSLALLVNKQTAHPYQIAASEDCPECEKGKIQFCKKCKCDVPDCNHPEHMSDYWAPINCKNCGGSGNIGQDPAKMMIVPHDQMGNDLIKIIAFNPETSKVQAENVKDVEMRIMRSLHLNYIEVAQSGVAKDKDMETRYQFLSLIANSLFDDLVYNWIKDILAIRNVRVVDGLAMPDNSVSYSIVKPTQFAIETASELLEDYKSSYDAKMPDYILSKQLLSYVDKKFGGDLVYMRKVQLINEMDKIAVTPSDRVSVLLLQGGIARKDLQFHTDLPLILDKLERENGSKWFLETNFDIIKSEVDKLFKELAPPDPLTIADE